MDPKKDQFDEHFKKNTEVKNSFLTILKNFCINFVLRFSTWHSRNPVDLKNINRRTQI